MTHSRRRIASPFRAGALFLAWLVASVPLLARPAAAFETPAREAILLDATTGTVLFEKNADVLTAPASMSKLMTLFVAFEELAAGRLSLDDTLPVSEKAWRMGGSKMFVLVNTRVRVEDLLRGIIVQSGNDASIVLAEGIAGTEKAFAELMTRRAREVGLVKSTFDNATGWPDPKHKMTVREIAHLARLIIRKFPQYYHYFAERTFEYGGIKQFNRNPLLGRTAGVDGLKTGHTQESGYGIVVSAERDGRRLILVVNGLESERQRARESAKLLEWGFREFNNYPLFAAGETVEEAEVWMGRAKTVPMNIPRALTVTLPRRARPGLKVVVRYENPVKAPVAAGQQIGTLRVTAPETPAIEVPLVAGGTVPRKGFFGRIGALFTYLLFGET